MARVKLTLDSQGMREMLTSAPVAAAVHALADDVREHAAKHDAIVRNKMPVKVDDYTTDRAASAVIIAHAGGLPVQAKHGVLTKAAHAAGLRVKGKAE